MVPLAKATDKTGTENEASKSKILILATIYLQYIRKTP